ncbi:serine/threonine protein kinase [Yimella sp. cx-573]|nr:serine/threonine protein kinase [Yimella sp. cx-573]
MDVSQTLGGRYVMQSRIAGGGMGEVWTAHDEVLDRTVAIKVIRRELADDPDFAARFHHEARTAARLSHANIAQVHDFGREGDTDYLVMEFVRGTSLADLLDRQGGLPAEQVVSIITQAAAGLEAAHEAGVIHRDVKPANILLTEKGTVKLTDFGIARALGAAKMTRTGEVMGTAQYLPPESALGRDVTGQADLYSLAVVAYEALVGRRPFVADSAVTLAMKHINEQPPPLPGTIVGGVRDAVHRGLAKNPDQRQRGVGNFARELRAGLASTPARVAVPPAAPYGGQGPYVGPRSGPHYAPAAMTHAAAPQPGFGPPAYASYPIRRGSQPADAAARGLGWTWIILSLGVALSFFLPWASLDGQSWSAFALAQAEESYTSSPESGGVAAVMAVFTVIVGALGLPQALGKGHIAFSIVALVLCFIPGVLWFAAFSYIDGTTEQPSPLGTGAGAWLCLALGFLHLPVIFTTLFKRR